MAFKSAILYHKNSPMARPSAARLPWLLVLAHVCSCKTYYAPDYGGIEREKVYYSAMKIDPVTLRVTAGRNAIISDTPPKGGYYVRKNLNAENNEYAVSHFLQSKEPYPVRLSRFFVDGRDRLIMRKKSQELLRGVYGTIYAQTTYFYRDRPEGHWNDFFTVLDSNEAPHEPPVPMASLPKKARSEFDGVSVARVIKAVPGHLVVSANYDPAGWLESIHLNAAKDGDWVDSGIVETLRGLEGGTSLGDAPKLRERFGLPARFPVAAFSAKPAPVCAKVKLDVVLEVVHFHYGRNRWVRQDVFSPRGHFTRFLSFAVTAHDKALFPFDQTRPFGRRNGVN